MSALTELARVTRELGQPEKEFVIIAEGNTSVADADGTFWVKASGVRMARAREEDFVQLDAAPLVALLDGPELSETELKEATAAARIAGAARPSIEAIFHALCLSEIGARAAAHTHPVAVNGLLCSSRSRLLAGGLLFPDQAVVLGPRTAYVEYHPPGIALARAIRRAAREFADAWGDRPRLMWLENHGVLALGDSPDETVHITEMAAKFARILTVASTGGEPRWLPEEHAFELVGREDEQLRRRMLTDR